MSRFLILAVMAALLAGCSELQHYSNTGFAPVIDSGRGVNRWLGELHETRAMSPEMVQQTLEVWEQDFHDDPTATNRMRLALLLATGEGQVGDRKQARKLLNGLDAWAGGDSERELVAILQQFLDEQGQSRRKINILWKQVTEQNQRIEELEQQLQALTTIEQNIQQRDKAGD